MVALAALIALTPEGAWAQSDTPRLISHQGYLTDSSSGDPVGDATYQITFRIYPTDSGGSALWTETQSLQTSGGVFDVVLGSVTPLDSVQFNRPLWLSIQVDPDPEMTQRIELTSTPYALGLALPFADTVASDVPLIHLDNSGDSDGILVTNTGSGTAGAFIQEDAGSGYSGVYGASHGSGSAVLGQHYGTGSAGRFVIENGSSSAPALYAETKGDGPGAFIKDGRLEVEYNSALGDPSVLIRETSEGDYARLSMRNDDNANYWDIAAGGPSNIRLNFFRAGTGDVMSLTESARVGIATVNPQARLHVNGVVRADSIVYNTPLQSWSSVHGSAFLPLEQDGTIEWMRTNGGFHFTGGTTVAAFAPIQFPNNAELETLSCRVYDVTGSENLTCKLCAEEGNACLLVGDVTSSGSGGQDTYTTSLTPVSVDNQSHSYFVVVQTEGATNWSTYSTALRIVGVSVGYAVGGAP